MHIKYLRFASLAKHGYSKPSWKLEKLALIAQMSMSRNHGVWKTLMCSFTSNINWASSLTKGSKRDEALDTASFSREEKGTVFNSREPRAMAMTSIRGRCALPSEIVPVIIVDRRSFCDRVGRYVRCVIRVKIPVESCSESDRQKFDTAASERVLFRRGLISRT